MAKTFGEMTPAERQAAMRRVAAKLQAELRANADAISRIMDDAETGELADDGVH